jgi:triacylglycerol lipase
VEHGEKREVSVHLLKWAMLMLPLLAAGEATASEPPTRHDTVILVHGLFNRPIFMKRIEWALEREGYHVVNWGYPSRDCTIEEHAAKLDRLVRSINGKPTIHFVGFSLGSLVIRYYLTHYGLPQAGRFVMIAPPNHGSERADQLYHYRWFRWLYGTRSTDQLRASNRKFYEELGRPSIEFGIIAGGRGDDRGFSRLFGGDNDGTVSVESAKLSGSADFILLPHLHTMLLLTPETSRQVVAFLRTGRFDQGGAPFG